MKRREQIHRLISTVDFLVSIALVTASLVDNNKSCFSVRKSKALHSLRLYLFFLACVPWWKSMYGKNGNDMKDLPLAHRRSRLSRLLFCDEELMKVIFLPDLSLSAPKPAQHEGKLIFHGSKQRGERSFFSWKWEKVFFPSFCLLTFRWEIFMTIKEEEKRREMIYFA